MRKFILLLSLMVALLLPIHQAHAIFGFSIVFDPKNFTQNILTASRNLMMINNQINSLRNEVRMLENMSKNLKNLGYDSIPQLKTTLSQMHLIIEDAKGLALKVSAIEADYLKFYPKQYSEALSHDDYVKEAHARWLQSRSAFEHSLKTQAGLIESLQSDEQLWERLVEQSQKSVGALQLGQVTNQMLALRAQQQAKSQQMMAMHYRAIALEKSRLLAEKEKARVQRISFLGDGKSYTPIAIKLN
ncbi:P-type conjugative transfer protein TrbJ [Paremcibacter congregatus]|uniref:P-type conjugative transfer protein TrbJ n=1 Tax=Paremcibacter congregatus TaxID=2043170 RepID=A0A2G4YNY5_9PROT|nr:P-type conjugative transfer protein TrbJ [Paremcibacter congregatus]PHZ84013.1 P-type conjugative transfer protein TrbJ [Paremcibacter congregatus]QDE26286.1 P-type conjugative transfer protein TrbJ [Paremcibacter congregatus]